MHLVLQLGGVRFEVRGVAGLLTMVAIGLAAAAVIEQFLRPPAQRTWYGRLWGAVPYDLRPPTWTRTARSVWNPVSDEILSDKPFGVGWSVNLAALRKKLGDLTN